MSCYRQSSQLFQNLLTDMDVLLGSSKDFLLGRWLEAAKALGTTVLVSQSQSVLFSFGTSDSGGCGYEISCNVFGR